MAKTPAKKTVGSSKGGAPRELKPLGSAAASNEAALGDKPVMTAKEEEDYNDPEREPETIDGVADKRAPTKEFVVVEYPGKGFVLYNENGIRVSPLETETVKVSALARAAARNNALIRARNIEPAKKGPSATVQ
jgi:hypothetical protein